MFPRIKCARASVLSSANALRAAASAVGMTWRGDSRPLKRNWNCAAASSAYAWEIRLPRDRLLKITHRFAVVFVSGSHCAEALYIRFVCLGIDRLPNTRDQAWWRCPSCRESDVGGDPLLEGQHVPQVAFVALGPYVAIGLGSNELRGHPHP